MFTLLRSMGDGKLRIGLAEGDEAPELPRYIAGPLWGIGYGNGSPRAAKSATPVPRPARFRRALRPGPAPGSPRGVGRYKGARAWRTVARTDRLRTACRDTSPPPDRSPLSRQRDRGR